MCSHCDMGLRGLICGLMVVLNCSVLFYFFVYLFNFSEGS